jgi:hypothetical protein
MASVGVSGATVVVGVVEVVVVGAVVVVVESAGVSTVVALEGGVVVDGTERLAGAVDEPESSLHAARVTMATATARTPWRHLRASAMR